MSECAKLEKLCKDAVLKYGPIEEGDERVYEQTLAGVLNAPRANEYATSSQGVRLHTRTDWQTSFEQLGLPSDFSKKGRFVPDSSPRSPTKTKGIILLIHGLGGHSNKLPWTYYAHHMYQQGYHPVSFDFHAHGWTGDFYPGPNGASPELDWERGLIERWEDLIDDCVSVVQRLYISREEEEEQQEQDEQEDKLNAGNKRSKKEANVKMGKGDGKNKNKRAKSSVDDDDDDDEEEEEVEMNGSARDRNTKSKRRGAKGDNDNDRDTSDDEGFYLKHRFSLDTPIFFQGTSMGGSVALLISSIFSKLGKARISTKNTQLRDFSKPEYVEAIQTETFKQRLQQWRRTLSVFAAEDEEEEDPSLINRFFAPVFNVFNYFASGALPAKQMERVKRAEKRIKRGVKKVIDRIPNIPIPALPAPGSPYSPRVDPEDQDVLMNGFEYSPKVLAHLCDIGEHAFAGCVLMSPALKIDLPPAIVVFLLQNVAQPLFPGHPVPESVKSISDDSISWHSQHYHIYNKADAYPHGLSWGKNVKFATSSQVLKIADACLEEFHCIDFPYITVHDPKDATTSFQGSIDLMEKAGRGHPGITEKEFMRRERRAKRANAYANAENRMNMNTNTNINMKRGHGGSADTDTGTEDDESVGGSVVGEGEIEGEREDNREYLDVLMDTKGVEIPTKILKENAHGLALPLAGGLHDVISNKTDIVFDEMLAFVEEKRKLKLKLKLKLKSTSNPNSKKKK